MNIREVISKTVCETAQLGERKQTRETFSGQRGITLCER